MSFEHALFRIRISGSLKISQCTDGITQLRLVFGIFLTQGIIEDEDVKEKFLGFRAISPQTYIVTVYTYDGW